MKQIPINSEQDISRLEWDYSEAMIQHTCKAWFDATFPELNVLLFSAENGGFRTPKAAAMAKYEGMVSGAPDLVLFPTHYNSQPLGIEMKRPRKPANKQFGIKGRAAGVPSEEQKTWRAICELNGGKYSMCYGLLGFVCIICEHFGLDAEPYRRNVIKNYYKYR